ncbi:class I SAM-dependent methyltransferase [Phytomonospora endophytica]|uniref:SAM-dependent methyltransferase n=1 Tax=Phytomonospora endophytica TaxID=714109 RepID=A0A841FC04_9ACTN|nr:class I SAM-dependent methyltransferase [Phytomonospora endophytica]MBB6033796.1 SAM-dependent methyltransferase [Phytomonospora endophytica]GIG64686.1 hypothetical protein Pen01_09810 [Phytomonospora endophytica]
MTDSTVAPEVHEYYERGGERTRLTASATGRLEFLRTRDILRRLIGEAPATVLDVGGGTGVHAAWLAGDGHAVTLIDPIASQVAVAAALPGVDARIGDARALPLPDASFDAVLLMGPLYHLQTTEERVTALREARRVAKPGGLIVAAVIGRFAPWLDGLRWDLLTLDGAPAMLDKVAATGELRPRDYGLDTVFTTAYAHRPEQADAEFAAAGLTPDTYAVEGAAWLVSRLEALLDEDDSRTRLLDGLRAFEREPSLLGASSHLLVTARNT